MLLLFGAEGGWFFNLGSSLREGHTEDVSRALWHLFTCSYVQKMIKMTLLVHDGSSNGVASNLGCEEDAGAAGSGEREEG